jgi:hypothetical protein
MVVDGSPAPGKSFSEVATRVPVRFKLYAQPAEVQRVAQLIKTGEGCPHVIELRLDFRQRDMISLANGDAEIDGLRELKAPSRVAEPDRLVLNAGCEMLQGEVTDRFQHAETLPAGSPVDHDHHAFVDQRSDAVHNRGKAFP